jgi:predicted aspartyl protease
MQRTAFVVLLGLLTGALAPAPAFAEIYRYTDERGSPVYVEGLESVPEAYRSRAVPLGMRNNAPVSTPPADVGKPVAAGGTTIRYTPGQRITVDATVNGSTSTRLLLDTGADTTLISPLVLSAAGASLTRGGSAGRMTGVTGTTDIRRVGIESLAIGEARVSRLQVVAHDMDMPGIDGLLGRDFLDQFKVTIDSTTGVVTLQPK